LVVLLIFILARVLPNIIDSHYIIYEPDNFFHRTLVDRIKTGQPLNDAINMTTKNAVYWNVIYVTGYPKLFHYVVALLPFSADLSIAIAAAFLVSILLFGIFLLTFILSNSYYKALMMMCLFLLVPYGIGLLFTEIYHNSCTIDYKSMYLFYTYTQIIINNLIIYFLIAATWVFNRFRKDFKKLVILTVLGVLILFLLMTAFHRTIYIDNPFLEQGNILRLLPIIVSMVLPFISLYMSEKFARICCQIVLFMFIIMIVLSNIVEYNGIHVLLSNAYHESWC
jgi:hypothetical protein